MRHKKLVCIALQTGLLLSLLLILPVVLKSGSTAFAEVSPAAPSVAMLGALRGMLDRLVMDSSFRLFSMMIMRSTSPVQMMPMALKFVYIKPMSLRLRFLRLKNLRQLSLPSLRLLMPQILLTVPISFVRQRVIGRRLMSPADPNLRVRMFKYMRSMPRLRKHGPSPMTRTVS